MTAKSTFALRLEFSRARQHILGTWQEDQALARDLGIAPSRISELKARREAPGAARTLALAKSLAVDPGWLAFGEDSTATPPEGWAAWLQKREGQRIAAFVPAPPARKAGPKGEA